MADDRGGQALDDLQLDHVLVGLLEIFGDQVTVQQDRLDQLGTPHRSDDVVDHLGLGPPDLRCIAALEQRKRPQVFSQACECHLDPPGQMAVPPDQLLHENERGVRDAARRQQFCCLGRHVRGRVARRCEGAHNRDEHLELRLRDVGLDRPGQEAVPVEVLTEFREEKIADRLRQQRGQIDYLGEDSIQEDFLGVSSD